MGKRKKDNRRKKIRKIKKIDYKKKRKKVKKKKKKELHSKQLNRDTVEKLILIIEKRKGNKNYIRTYMKEIIFIRIKFEKEYF